MIYEPIEDQAVRFIHEHAPNCVECGQVITDLSRAERAPRRFRVRHRGDCPNQASFSDQPNLMGDTK